MSGRTGAAGVSHYDPDKGGGTTALDRVGAGRGAAQLSLHWRDHSVGGRGLWLVGGTGGGLSIPRNRV